MPIPDLVWEDISIDFVEGLPLSQGLNTILVVVDRLSKYAYFIGLKHPFDAFAVATVFMKEVVRLHGFPASIVSDRDRIFLSTFWKELFKLHGTALRKSTAYHPKTDGQTEIVNKSLETYLRCFAGSKPREWAKWLSWAEFSYNTSPHCSTKFSPFRVLYGRDAPHIVRLERGHTPVNSLDEFLQERDAVLDELHFHLLRAQQTMKKTADIHRRDVEFMVDDWVYLKLQPYRQQSLSRRPCEKLAARFYGPFRVIQRIGRVAYKLDLPTYSKLHPVLHISQLKKVVGNVPVVPTLPAQITADCELVAEPETILEVRQVQTGTGL